MKDSQSTSLNFLESTPAVHASKGAFEFPKFDIDGTFSPEPFDIDNTFSLRAICEVAATPDHEDGLFGEIVNVILNASASIGSEMGDLVR